MRPLGIPTVADRIAQQVVKKVLEPLVEPCFLPDSYAYRPGKAALDAVAITRKRCWRSDWLIDLDIKGFFDNLDHDLVMRAVSHHTTLPWVKLYILRWLKAPMRTATGDLVERSKGTPQGGVISPLLANLFMHYAFDLWLRRTHPQVAWARFADDAVVHAQTKEHAEALLTAIKDRLGLCGLEVHPTKTKIVYCKDDDRPGEHDCISFDFLGYTYRPRRAKNRYGKFFVSFLPGISRKSCSSIWERIREWRIPSTRNNQTLEDIAALVNPSVRGWIQYYGKFYPSLAKEAVRKLDNTLAKWAARKYKALRGHNRRAFQWLGRVARRDPNLFIHWQVGTPPATGS